MKKSLVILLLLALAGVSNAEMIVNGNFEDPAGSGWSQWYGGNSGKYFDALPTGNHAAGVWWMDDGVFQGMAIGAGTFTVSGDVLTQAGYHVDNGREGVIVAEVGVWNPDKWGPGVGGIDVWWTQDVALVISSSPGDTWIHGSTTIDNTAAGATYLNVNLFLRDTWGAGSGVGGAMYDNVSVVPEPVTLGLLALGGLLLRRRK